MEEKNKSAERVIIFPIPIYGNLVDINLSCDEQCHLELIVSKEKKGILEHIVKLLRTSLKGEDVRILIDKLKRG